MTKRAARSGEPDGRHEGHDFYYHAFLVDNLKGASVYSLSAGGAAGQDFPSGADRFLPCKVGGLKDLALQIPMKGDSGSNVEEISRHRITVLPTARPFKGVVGGSGWFGPRRRHIAPTSSCRLCSVQRRYHLRAAVNDAEIRATSKSSGIGGGE